MHLHNLALFLGCGRSHLSLRRYLTYFPSAIGCFGLISMFSLQLLAHSGAKIEQERSLEKEEGTIVKISFYEVSRRVKFVVLVIWF